jgi:hypothetical protein
MVRSPEDLSPLWPQLSGMDSILPRYRATGDISAQGAPLSPMVIALWAAVGVAAIFMFVHVTTSKTIR